MRICKIIKKLLWCTDLNISWKKITKSLPKWRQASNDRAQTIEEIRKLIKYQDRRIKPIVCTMFSSGIQLGTWDFLQWKHVIPVTEENGEKIVSAKLRVYAET